MSALTEASTNFDLENVKPFLVRLSTHVDGFGPAQIDPLVEDVAGMSVDAEKSWAFDVVHDGEPTPLHIRVFMDDEEAPDLYFFTSAALAATINQEMKAYFDELGM